MDLPSRRVVRDETGAPRYIEGLNIDITSRKRAEAAYNDILERYRSIVTGSIDGVILCGATGDIVTVNPETERIFGLSESELALTGLAGVIDDSQGLLTQALAGLARSGRFRGSSRACAPAGRPCPWRCRPAPLPMPASRTMPCGSCATSRTANRPNPCCANPRKSSAAPSTSRPSARASCPWTTTSCASTTPCAASPATPPPSSPAGPCSTSPTPRTCPTPSAGPSGCWPGNSTATRSTSATCTATAARSGSTCPCASSATWPAGPCTSCPWSWT